MSLTLRTTALFLCLAALSACDTAAPSSPTTDAAPTTLRVVPREHGSMHILWEPVAQQSTLEWAQENGAMGRLDVGADRGSALIAGIGENERVTLRLRGRNGEVIAQLVAVPFGNLIPSPPTALSAVRTSETAVVVSWERPSDPTVSGYMIFWASGTVGKPGMSIVRGDQSSMTIETSPNRALLISITSMRGQQFSPAASTMVGAFDSATPENLRASSLSPTSVSLLWSAVSGAGSYRVEWTSSAGGGNGSMEVTDPLARIEGLTAGVPYTFTVSAVDMGQPASIAWAGATRFTVDAAGAPIRMYESASTSPSALALDGPQGPTPVSLSPSQPGRAQLAMYVSPATGGGVQEIVIGPIYAIVEYRIATANDFSKVDSSVYISGSTYNVTTLDAWYLSEPLSSLIDPMSNVKAYVFGASIGSSQGIIVRMGNGANQHYARVLLKAVNGSILQGTFPNRYVELEVSYQSAPNVPYAKRAVPTPGVRATVRP